LAFHLQAVTTGSKPSGTAGIKNQVKYKIKVAARMVALTMNLWKLHA
jgi:hypothetical protein